MISNISVLFVCCAYSECEKAVYQNKSKRGYQFAAQNFQEAIIDGLLENNIALKVLSIPSLSTFPMGSSIPYVNDNPFFYKEKELGKSFGYINVPFFNRPTRLNVDSWIDEWYNSASGDKVIIVYALQKTHMDIALRAKKRYPDIKICIIILDLPRYMGCNKYYKLLGLQKRDINWIYKSVLCFDAYVVLSEPMVHDLNISTKPFVVVEGIYSPYEEEVEIAKDDKKVVLYTGNINKRYGIELLLDAFEKIKDDNFRLWIRGTGNSDYIIKRSEQDKRISYIGPLSKKDLILLQKKATLLVNPVSPKEEFTAYFFPSKTIDYLASGTPTLMFKLRCIPDDYDTHLIYIRGESAEEMAQQIIEICSMPQEELNEIGAKGARFINENKKASVQVNKILKMLDSIKS